MPNRPFRSAYDHRIRDLVCEARSPAPFAQLGIFRSTTASWMRRGSRPVVTTQLFGQDEQRLRVKVLKVERRVQLLLGIVRLLFVMVRLFGLRLDSQRVPSGEAKSCVLAAIERAKNRVSLAIALRVLAQVDFVESNSILEAWWRTFRKNWPHLNALDTVAAVRRLTSFHIAEHNTVLPHSAFHGQTPDEVYFGRGDHVPEHLAEAWRLARQARLRTNRRLTCEECCAGSAPPDPSEQLPRGKGEPQ